MLHTARPFTVTLQRDDGVLRIEVVDSSPDRMPIRVPTRGSAVDITSISATGRGLQIVSALAQRWGIELGPNLKTVWCEFEGDGLPAQPSDPSVQDGRPTHPRPSDVHRLRFHDLPVRAAIASGLDVEDAIQDVQLRGAARTDDDDVMQLLSLVDRTASLRLAGRHAAMHAASEDRLRFDLEVDATDDALAATAELNRALADAGAPGRRGPGEEVVAFRSWLGEETLRQREGSPPSPFPADGEDRRADELLRALQRTLIPPTPPAVPGLDVAAAYHPAQGEVGGDFFDVFEVADGDWCVVLGDVSGKGVEAAILTSTARHAVRSGALREPVPSGLMRVLNQALVDHGGSRFCTVALLRLQRVQDAWVATLTSGGHPFPLLLRHGTTTKMGRPGSLLGVFEQVAFHDVSIRPAKGDALVLYTDGVTEARNHAGEFFGEDRMCEAIVGSSYSAEAIVDGVVASVLGFQAGAADDIALVVIRRP